MLKRGALTGPKLLERQIFHNFLIFYVKLFVETYTDSGCSYYRTNYYY